MADEMKNKEVVAEIEEVKEEEQEAAEEQVEEQAEEVSEDLEVSADGSAVAVKENWFAAKLRQFRKWKTETGIKIDHWSRKKPLRRKLYLNRTLYLMMLPYMVGFTLFTILPVLISLYLSFTSFNMLQFPRFVGFNNYLTLFLDDEIFITAIKNTEIFFFR